MRVVRSRSLPCSQRIKYARAHLCRRLARERDRENFFRPIGTGQQGQKPRDQQAGLAGSGRRLDDE
jgi:hypothetical protein